MQYRVSMTFFVEADSSDDAEIKVNDGISADLASNYYLDYTEVID